MTYEHTQRGRFHFLFLGLAALFLAAGLAAFVAGSRIGLGFLLFALLFLALTSAFARLTVRDGGDGLVLAFGPLRLLQRRVPYGDIREIRVARSHLIDGWGVHWVPGRGWTWNLWGRDCVELELEGGRQLRIGTDDPEGLARHLRAAAARVAPPGQPGVQPE